MPSGKWLAAIAPLFRNASGTNIASNDSADDGAKGVAVASGTDRQPQGFLVIFQRLAAAPECVGHGIGCR